MHGGFVVFIPCTEVSWLFSSHVRRFCDYFVHMQGGFVVFIPCTEVLWLFSSNVRRFCDYLVPMHGGFVLYFSSERFCDFFNDFSPHFFTSDCFFISANNEILYWTCIRQSIRAVWMKYSCFYTVLKDVIKLSLTFSIISVSWLCPIRIISCLLTNLKF